MVAFPCGEWGDYADCGADFGWTYALTDDYHLRIQSGNGCCIYWAKKMQAMIITSCPDKVIENPQTIGELPCATVQKEPIIIRKRQFWIA